MRFLMGLNLQGVTVRRNKVLLLDDDPDFTQSMETLLCSRGFLVKSASSLPEGMAYVAKERPELVLLGHPLVAGEGLEPLGQLRIGSPETQVVVVSRCATVATAVEAIRMGAIDYLGKPLTPDQLDLVLEKLKQYRKLSREVNRLQGIFCEGEMLTRNPEMRQILATARQAARVSSTVLISGESGTGKGLLARLIHQWSSRADRPLVTVDCAALQESLLESDLFGHIRGAFTGALRDKVGKISLADQGTLFLDEVSEIPGQLQGKLLRFLQHRTFERLGDPQPRSVDVRIVAATNRDLDELVRGSRFRQDLHYRLRVIELSVPPLRERPEDIPLLVDEYQRRYALANMLAEKVIDEECMRMLCRYPWPGNVRELQNAMERAVVLSTGERITSNDFPHHITKGAVEELAFLSAGMSLAEVEKRHIERILATASSLEEAARTLGINVATLWRKRKLYRLG